MEERGKKKREGEGRSGVERERGKGREEMEGTETEEEKGWKVREEDKGRARVTHQYSHSYAFNHTKYKIQTAFQAWTM